MTVLDATRRFTKPSMLRALSGVWFLGYLALLLRQAISVTDSDDVGGISGEIIAISEGSWLGIEQAAMDVLDVGGEAGAGAAGGVLGTAGDAAAMTTAINSIVNTSPLFKIQCCF
ncbi:hypothetical protein J6590_099086 [Homalodisca vitripennis]|nr:hypothetical protein J6590_099086 [Homalodisca vitripennis]